MDKLISGVIIEDAHALTLEELCNAVQGEKTLIIQMVEYELIQPEGETPEQWRFDSVSLKRVKTAMSFYHDLEVNMSGIALALDLLDQIQQLQRQLEFLEKNNK